MLASHLILIGLRGSGKTTIGRLLARAFNAPFIDLDDRTPRATGHATVTHLWQDRGESGFRDAEARALADALAEPSAVLALGGGTPIAPGAAAQLSAAVAGGAHIVYLRATPDTLARRLAHASNAHRPSLTGHSVSSLQEVTAVFNARDPLYVQVADTIVEIDGLNVEQAVRRIMTALPNPPSSGR